ncbi:MAG: hypothetical protein OEZ06_07980 [Myxococcales bacterium]|nr:hypothetical protein [Myxococcales bacterium]
METLAEAAPVPQSERRTAAAVCARHPDRRASIVCPHCGTYACGGCTADTLWGDTLCEECLRRGRAQYPLPFERSLSPISLIQTAYLLFAEARYAFTYFPDGRARRSLAFALQIGMLLGLLAGLREWLFAPHHWAAERVDLLPIVGLSLLRIVSSTLLFVVMVASVFHGAASLLGARPPLSLSVRVASYLSVVQLLEVVTIIADTVLMGSVPVSVILRLVGAFFLAWDLSLVAEHRLGLRRGKAIAAGVAPVLVLLLLVVALVLGFAYVQSL